MLDPSDPTAIAQLRRSVAMLQAGRRDGLDRETAVEVLAELEDLQSLHRRCADAVECPHCFHPFIPHRP